MSSLSFVLFQKSQVEHFKKMDWILLRSACLKAISFTVILWSDWHSMQAGKILEHLCPWWWWSGEMWLMLQLQFLMCIAL